MDDNIKLYLPFSKKDNDQRIVAGYATSEDLDSQGEVIKIDAIKKALPDYMKFANIREMHQPSAVGKAVKATIDETKKAMYLVAKVVDDIAWKKCKEGVYNGFSIGGHAIKMVGNQIEELILSEISLVDRPANPTAVFSLIKMDTKKSAGEMMDEAMDMHEEMKYTEVFRADRILQLTAELVYLYDNYKATGIETAEVEKAILILKDMVKKELERATGKEKVENITLLKGIDISLSMRSMDNKKEYAEDYFQIVRKVLG